MKFTHLAAAAVIALCAAGCISDPRLDPQTHGLLTIESAPPGAQIIIDGNVSGEVTPRTYANMNVGLRDVRLVLPGFQTSVTQILVLAGERVRVYVQLEPVVSRGSLPRSAIDDLADAFSRRDLARLGELLAPSYLFRLRPSDVANGLPAALDRAQELGFASEVFRRVGETADLSRDLRMNLEIRAQLPDPRPGHSGGYQFQADVSLYARFPGGSVLQVHEPATLYVRRDLEAGAAWQVVEWVDGESEVPGPSLGRLHFDFPQARVRGEQRPAAGRLESLERACDKARICHFSLGLKPCREYSCVRPLGCGH